MTIAKEDMLALASELLEMSSECAWRSSVSRGYYAAYHGCWTWEASHGVPGSNEGANGGEHQKLLNRLRHPPPELKDEVKRSLSKVLAPSLEALRNTRHEADYDLHTDLGQERARNHVARAGQLLQRLA